ncbi:MAG: sodium:solute symporter [Gemmatimonadota bacterium]|nr:MAG: sodium:solute symporter [Gemmatimonadota bacterium]
MTGFTGLDLAVLLAYLAGVTAWGAWLGRGQSGGRDYFLGNRDLPWLAVMLSVVATETSTLTFLSIPGVSYLGSMGFLQLTLGYLVGRVAISVLLLPAYYRGDLNTAYALLEDRFGLGVRRFTSSVFMVTRLLADSVRLFATAIPLALVTGWDYPVSIAAIGVATVIYTYFGGIRAVVWVDVLQMCLYLVGALVALVALQTLVPSGWPGIFAEAQEAGKLAVFDFSADPAVAYTFWAGLLGGGFLTMASHGTDQLIVQRLLTCRSLRDSQKALVGSGVVVIGQFALFLLVGLGLWTFYGARSFARSDEIFALFIVEELPTGLTGLLIAGVFAAAMSSLSSSVNSLASATAYDLWAPLAGAEDDERRILRVGKVFTLVWAGLLIGGAILFIPLSRGTSAVEVALAVASIVYGGLLGAFALGVLSDRADSRSAIIGMIAGIGTVAAIWAVGRVDPAAGGEWPAIMRWVRAYLPIAWPWFVPIGTAVTVAVGLLLGRGPDRTAEEAAAVA